LVRFSHAYANGNDPFLFQHYPTAFIDSGFMMHTSVHKFLASGTLTFFIISLTDTELDFDSYQQTVTYIYVTHEILAAYRLLPDDRRETGSLPDSCI
jgi:hypothetical protein